MPLLWLQRARESIKIKKGNDKDKINVIVEVSFKTKIQLAFYWLIKNSQELHPPPKLDAGHSIITKNDITCIKDSLDSRLFRVNILPIIGKD